ncbi:MAG TPA: nuclear transport factor 2 family protein [Thermoanaerobaculia bacterium]|nr:nuclear transport factor 2 family protein [Thermoanaerobaculia bacterium]
MTKNPIVEISRIVGIINEAWLGGRAERIGLFLHEDVVIYPPGFGTPVVGREACVQSYAQFALSTKVHDFTAQAPHINVFGASAVALCPYRIVYELEGQVYREAGYDLLVFSRVGEHWQVVWRTLSIATDPAP